jgi:hypothetical protein
MAKRKPRLVTYSSSELIARGWTDGMMRKYLPHYWRWQTSKLNPGFDGFSRFLQGNGIIDPGAVILVKPNGSRTTRLFVQWSEKEVLAAESLPEVTTKLVKRKLSKV